MFDATTLLSYLAAAALLAVAPGPGQMLVLARSVAGGPRAGLATAFGLALGSLVHTVAAALGLSALLSRSATLYTIVQYAGAAYLVFLGVKALRTRPAPSAQRAGHGPPSLRRGVARGALTGILNPKVALFFLAFLPQFVRPGRGHVLLQFLVLGLLFTLLALLSDTAVALASSHVSRAFRRREAFALWRERALGLVLVALGFRLALARRA